MIKKILALVSVVVLLTALAPIAVFAQTDDTIVSGTLGSYYTITAPTSVSLGTLDNTTVTSSAGQTLSVETNDATKTTVDITVKDTSASFQGYLKSSSVALSSALQLSGTGLSTIDPLTGSDQTLTSGATLSGTGVKTWSVSDLVIAQPAFDMVAAGTYTTTITFTATFN